MSTFFQQFFCLVGVRLTATSGYRSTANGKIEKQFVLLNRLLRGGNVLDQSSWVEKLPLALNSINMMPRRSLGGLSPIGVETGT